MTFTTPGPFSVKKKTVNEQLFPSLYSQPQQKTVNASYPTNQSKTVNASFAQPKIMASGNGSQYANNTASKPQIKQTPLPKLPEYKPPVASANDTYINTMNKSTQGRVDLLNKAQADKDANLRKSSELKNQFLESQIPQYETDFNVFKTNTEAGIKDLQASGERQKATAEDEFGKAQRLDAQNRQQVRGETARGFANLGTLDSRGEGSYQQATENIDSEFNRNTSERLNMKANRIAEISESVGKAEREAIGAIRSEEAKKNSLLTQIRQAQQLNNTELEGQLIDSYNQTQQNILDIQDAMEQLKYSAQLESEKLTSEQADLEKQISGLSPNFLKTGVPETVADRFFIMKNKDTYKEILGTSGQSSSKQKSLDIAKKLSELNTQGITGPIRMAVSPTSREAEGLLQQLSSELQLEEAKRLKGQGSMSDAERAILRDAVASFNIDPKNPGRSRLYDQDFKRVLSDMIQRLSNETGQNSGGNIITAPDGQQIMIID